MKALVLASLLGIAPFLGPASVLLLAYLWYRNARPAAFVWGQTLAICLASILAIKIATHACGTKIPLLRVHSPSGHTSFSTLVCGAMALIAATESAGLRRVITISGAAGFILAIAASRLPLAHSAPEVGLGLVIGISALGVFGQGYLRCRAARVWLSPLFLVGGAVVLVLHGRELDAEHFLHAIAEFLRIRCA